METATKSLDTLIAEAQEARRIADERHRQQMAEQRRYREKTIHDHMQYWAPNLYDLGTVTYDEAPTPMATLAITHAGATFVIAVDRNYEWTITMPDGNSSYISHPNIEHDIFLKIADWLQEQPAPVDPPVPATEACVTSITQRQMNSLYETARLIEEGRGDDALDILRSLITDLDEFPF